MRENHIWAGVAKQLQEIAEDLAFTCDVDRRMINIQTYWVEHSSGEGWTMSWVATITFPAGNTYSGYGSTPVEACRLARVPFIKAKAKVEKS